jgi:hypothetical protein
VSSGGVREEERGGEMFVFESRVDCGEEREGRDDIY